MRTAFISLLSLCPFCLCGDFAVRSAPPPRVEPHRSPMDVAVLPDGRRVLTANHTADSVSLVDLQEGKVLTELPVGHKPVAVACSRDGRRAAVGNLWSGTITLLDVQDTGLKAVAVVKVGAYPRSLAFAPNGESLYVAVAGRDEVLRLDWSSHKVLHRWPAPREPRHLALSRDGRYLAAASSRSAEVRCWDTQTAKPVWEKTIVDAFDLHGIAFSPNGAELIVPHCIRREFPLAKHNIDQGWAIDNRLTRLTREPHRTVEYWQIALDTRGKAVGDVCGPAFNARGNRLAIAAAGTHEILVFETDGDAMPWSSGDPGDFLDYRLDRGDGKMRRVPVGGRPLAVQFVADTDQAVVANHLLDAVQVIDAEAGKLVKSIPLGGPEKPSLARQGEAIFYDALRSHHQWFSCHTCHVDGHTNGRLFDTLNDDSYGNPKLTPTLRGVAHTAPYTWHGWQDDLGKAVEKSLTETMFGPKPTADDVKALVAFLGTLDHPPNPHLGAGNVLSEAAQRGKTLFHGKARCARCHQGENYTSTKNYDVKLEPDGSPYDLWNPPSLRGLWDRGPYLHDGRARTLEELLRADHSPQKLGGAELTPGERRDLIEFLKSL